MKVKFWRHIDVITSLLRSLKCWNALFTIYMYFGKIQSKLQIVSHDNCNHNKIAKLQLYFSIMMWKQPQCNHEYTVIVSCVVLSAVNVHSNENEKCVQTTFIHYWFVFYTHTQRRVESVVNHTQTKGQKILSVFFLVFNLFYVLQ